MINLKITNIDNVGNRIRNTFDEYSHEAFLIYKYYAAEIVKYFITVQTSQSAEVKAEFWTNHTFKAAKSFFARAYQSQGKIIGITLNYNTSLAPYVTYLENYYGGRFAALPSLIDKFYPMIEHDLKVLYGEI